MSYGILVLVNNICARNWRNSATYIVFVEADEVKLSKHPLFLMGVLPAPPHRLTLYKEELRPDSDGYISHEAAIEILHLVSKTYKHECPRSILEDQASMAKLAKYYVKAVKAIAYACRDEDEATFEFEGISGQTISVCLDDETSVLQHPSGKESSIYDTPCLPALILDNAQDMLDDYPDPDEVPDDDDGLRTRTEAM